MKRLRNVKTSTGNDNMYKKIDIMDISTRECEFCHNHKPCLMFTTQNNTSLFLCKECVTIIKNAIGG